MNRPEPGAPMGEWERYRAGLRAQNAERSRERRGGDDAESALAAWRRVWGSDRPAPTRLTGEADGDT